MKNRTLVTILILFAVYIGTSFFTKKNLLLENINEFKVTDYTKDNIQAAYFYFPGRDQLLSKDEIMSKFSLCDSIMIMNKSLFEKRYGLFGAFVPIFKIDVNQYSFYANIKNTTLAGTESLINRSHYLWLPWGWYNFYNEFLGGS